MDDSDATPPPIDRDDLLLIDWLRDRDVACPLCGYNLRQLTTPRCPECGQELRLAVTLVEPFLKAWIALAGSAWASAGVGILFLFLLAKHGWPDGRDRGADIPILVFIAMIPVAIVTLYLRRKLLRLDPNIQWALAALGVAIFVISITVFFETIR